MDKHEARLLLQACRPDGQDDASPVFAEALALVERDPELKAWWEAQRAFDRKFSAKLREVAVPEDLRATILAGRKIEQLTPRFRLPVWFSIAAAVVLLALIVAVLVPAKSARSGNLASTTYDAAAIDFLGDDSPSLGTTSADHGKLLAWLKQRNSPTGDIPATMTGVPSVGCQTFALHGHTVSLICFSLADGGVAHLFIVEKEALQDPPGDAPVYGKKGSWCTASWSDSNKSYLLVTEAGPETLKHLL